MTEQSTQLDSDWASAPGATLSDLMNERALSKEAIALNLGMDVDEVADLLIGKVHVTENLAAALGRTLGPSADFWSKREAHYRVALLRAEAKSKEAAQLSWIRSVPFAEISRWDWVRAARTLPEKMGELLRFFDASNASALEQQIEHLRMAAKYRTSPSHPNIPAALAVWLRRGEVLAQTVSLPNWDPRAFYEAMPAFKRLTRLRRPRQFMVQLTQLCADCGVALVIARAPSGCRVSGATRFIGSSPIMQLSFRYLSDDQFWFTFFHEAGHLLLHDRGSVFLEGDSQREVTREEAEANNFAERTLIPEEFTQEFRRLPSDKQAIRSFAMRLGISPGLVVGQLQHAGLVRHSELNGLKARFEWDEDSTPS